VAQDGDPIRHGEDGLKGVAHHDDRDPSVLQGPHQSQDLSRFHRSQGRRGLVHDAEFPPEGDGPPDGHALPLPPGQELPGPFHPGDLDAQTGQCVPGEASHPTLVQDRHYPEKASGYLSTGEQVGTHIGVLEQGEVLVLLR